MDVDALAHAWKRRLEEEATRLEAASNEARAKAGDAAAALCGELGAREVWLFGSLVDGPRHAAFDVDLAATGIPPERHFAAIARASQIVGRPVDLVALETAPPALAQRIRTRGIRLA